MNKVDEWFIEVCGICTQTKIVHDDKTSKFDNPSFICKECEDLKMSFLNKYLSSLESGMDIIKKQDEKIEELKSRFKNHINTESAHEL